MEITLLNKFSWSLKDLDDTDCESLLRFVMYYLSGGAQESQKRKILFCDQVDFL
jgi:hypothetical protein